MKEDKCIKIQLEQSIREMEKSKKILKTIYEKKIISKKIKIFKNNQIDEIVDLLNKDCIVCIPTDTVFGLCARMDSENAHDKLMKIKNRSNDKALPVMCSDIEQIKLISIVNKNAAKLIKAFMPGPITLVLKKNNTISNYVTNNKDTIAVRMASSKVLEDIIRKLNTPLFITSANKSGEPFCRSFDEIEKLRIPIDGIMEGKVFFLKESTIVDCSTEKIKILREGPISEEQIQKIVTI